jgi:hypothetical protein
MIPEMLKAKIAWLIISTLTMLFLSSCTLSELSKIKAENTATPSLLKTTMGDFVVVSTRLVEDVKDSKAPDGYKFLLIGLARPDLQKLVAGEFSLESFQSMVLNSDNEIYVLGGDGSQASYGGMGGWLDTSEPVADDFVIGFLVPIAETYTLYWTDNPPIPLNIED